MKTTNAKSEHSHSQSLSFGYATGYLRDHKPIFNSKPGPLLADVIVGVSYGSSPRFVVMPVAFAEKLCRKHCDYWFKVPKKSGEIRSPSFPIYRLYEGGQCSRTTLRGNKAQSLGLRGPLEILSEPIDRLHDETAWSLLE